MTYLLVLQNTADYVFEVSHLESSLRTQWEGVEFLATSAHLEWQIPMNGDDIFGFLLDEKKAISLDCFEEACAEFTIWLRSYIPEKCGLLLCHDGSSEIVEVHPTSTLREVLSALKEM